MKVSFLSFSASLWPSGAASLSFWAACLRRALTWTTGSRLFSSSAWMHISSACWRRDCSPLCSVLILFFQVENFLVCQLSFLFSNAFHTIFNQVVRIMVSGMLHWLQKFFGYHHALHPAHMLDVVYDNSMSIKCILWQILGCYIFVYTKTTLNSSLSMWQQENLSQSRPQLLARLTEDTALLYSASKRFSNFCLFLNSSIFCAAFVNLVNSSSRLSHWHWHWYGAFLLEFGYNCYKESPAFLT